MMADPVWKSALLHKGQDVADLLEVLLSGKDVDLASLPAEHVKLPGRVESKLEEIVFQDRLGRLG